MRRGLRFGCAGWRPALILIAALAAFAGDDNRPGRGVARISLIQGDVSVRRGDSGEWVAAAPNAPLVVGDRVLSGAASKAEVQMDYANMVRLAAHSEIRFAELEYERYLLQLASGTITYRILRDSRAEVEISTPSIAVRPLKKGAYRITILPDGSTEVTVRSGEAEIFTPRGSERLRSGRTMVARGSASDPEFQISQAIPRDDWDRWNEGRDRQLERSVTYRYVSPSIYGAEDLDDYGRWVYDPPYGWVWVPNVPLGWAPYRYGRWSWIDWYGWTWISYDPWGWAPFHYGRWYWGPRGWCWWPGAFRAVHYWSPGLVAWIGFGGYRSGVSVGFGFGWGTVGWIPLAPFEPYYPWYGWGRYRGYASRTFGDNSVTIVNNVNVTNVFRNARVAHAITGADPADFNSGRGFRALQLSQGQAERAAWVRGQLPLVPDRSSLRLADRELSSLPRGAEREQFFSRRSPAPIERVSFEEQRRGIEDLARRTFEPGRVAERSVIRESRAAGSTAGSGVEGPAGSLGRSAEERGWRRAESGNTEAGAGLEQGGQSGAGTGWRRVAEPVGGSERRVDRGLTQAEDFNSAQGSRRSSEGGWRRFGEPNPGVRERATVGVNPDPSRGVEGRQSGAEAGGWRRFGGTRENSAGTERSLERDRGAGWRWDDRPVEPRVQERAIGGRTERQWDRDTNSWRRFGQPQIDAPERSQPRVRDNWDGARRPETRLDAPRFDSPRWEQPERGGQEPLRLNPPIVRERTGRDFPQMSPGWDRGSRWENSAPRTERFEGRSPRFEGPRVEARPPMPSGGGLGRGGGMEGGGMRGSVPRGAERGGAGGFRSEGRGGGRNR